MPITVAQTYCLNDAAELLEEGRYPAWPEQTSWKEDLVKSVTYECAWNQPWGDYSPVSSYQLVPLEACLKQEMAKDLTTK